MNIKLLISWMYSKGKNEALEEIVGIPPATLNTLQKLADSINNDGTFQNTITTQLRTKASITEVTNALHLKSDRSTTYTKTEVNSALSGTANQATTYTKTEVDTSLSAKANQATTYSKTEVDSALSAKASQATTYTKTEIDSALSAKANQLTTYTKTEVESALSRKISSNAQSITIPTMKLSSLVFTDSSGSDKLSKKAGLILN